MNQPFDIPRGPDGKQLLSRSEIMGTNGNDSPPWTMFMPGQSSGSNNELPAVWPAAGSLLRVPKCVFLTSVPPAHLCGKNFTLMSKGGPYGYFGHYFDAVARDIRVTPSPTVNPYGSLVFQGFTGTYTYIGWTIDPQYPPAMDKRRQFNKCSVIPNAIYSEHLRLVGEFQSAKAILEAKYPNEVFVQICEFFPSTPAVTVAPQDELMPLVFDVYTPEGIAANAPLHGANGPAWLLGPDHDATNFFGTNFLHLYCGYQDDGGNSSPKSAFDAVNRWHWWSNNFGYKLDVNFGLGHDQWIEDPGIPDGYESFTYGFATQHMDKTLGSNSPEAATVSASTPLDFLRNGYSKFAGYKVALYTYDAPWDFPLPKFNTDTGAYFPCHVLDYGDQDWVEQTFFDYPDISEIFAGNPEICLETGAGGLDGDGNYNVFMRYPTSLEYKQTFLPALDEQFTLLTTALQNLGPKTAQIWNYLIDTHSLGDVGIGYAGGSSQLTADSIVALVEEHYGLG